MGARLLACGPSRETSALAAALETTLPGASVTAVERPWEVPERARSERFDVVVLLKGSVTEHEPRISAIASVRRDGFAGRIVAAGSFLSEKQDAIVAGADYVFDAERQSAPRVTAAAVVRPGLWVDHPYLRLLFAREWATVESYTALPPDAARGVVVASTSLHPDPAFWSALAVMARERDDLHCVVSEDDEDDATHAEALASGVQPYVSVAEKGLLELYGIVRRLLREVWLAEVTRA